MNATVRRLGRGVICMDLLITREFEAVCTELTVLDTEGYGL